MQRSLAPEQTEPGQLILSTEGACSLDPQHLLAVFTRQRPRFAAVLAGFTPGDWAARTRCADWSAHDVTGYATDYGLFIAAAVASMFGSPVHHQQLTLSGGGGGVFDLDTRDAVTLTVTQAAAAGPPTAEVTDALGGRAPVPPYSASCQPARAQPCHAWPTSSTHPPRPGRPELHPNRLT